MAPLCCAQMWAQATCSSQLESFMKYELVWASTKCPLFDSSAAHQSDKHLPQQLAGVWHCKHPFNG